MSSSAVPAGFLILCLGLVPFQAVEAATPTTHAFERIEGGSQRVFFRGHDRQIRLRVRNEGFIPWTQETGFTFSYQWLSPRGDLIAEGFRTRLPRDVMPDETVSLVARVKDVPRPGIYRLRWDMVQEGVTWFSEKDRTLEPARWVVILPSMPFFFALVCPCLAAFGGLLLWRLAPRDRWPVLSALASGTDIAWAGVSLYGKPYLLYAELPRRFTPEITWTNASAVALPLLVLLAVPRRWRPAAAWLTVAAGALLVWGQTLYLRFFGDVATSAAVLASRQTGEIRESIAFLAASTDWWLIADLVLAVPLLVALTRGSVGKPRRLYPMAALVIAALPILSGFLNIEDFTRGRNLRALRDVRDYGLYGYQLLDFGGLVADSLLSESPTADEIEAMAEAFRESSPTRAPVGPTAGVASGLNLLAIQVESMQQFVLDFEVDGQRIMPNLERLVATGLAFTAVQDQTSRGRSSAGDYIVNTSILPIAESVAYQHADNEHRGFAHALGELGYTTFSAIPYKRHFWNRYLTHPAYGFETSLFVEDFEPGIKVGWGLNDRDFLTQMMPKITALPEPFAAWLTTLSVHHPYKSFPAELKVLDLGDLEDTSLGNYLHGMNLFDRAFAAFFDDLRAAGLLDRTVIALWGDHSSGLLREERWVEYFDLEKAGSLRFQFRRVPFLLWVPNAPELRGRNAIAAGQLDIAPTLLALFGGRPDVEPFFGRNLLGQPGAGPVVHPRGSWTSDGLLYLNPREDDGAVRCWDPDRNKPQPGARCREGTKRASQQIEISERILRYDLQGAIAERLAAKPTADAATDPKDP